MIYQFPFQVAWILAAIDLVLLIMVFVAQTRVQGMVKKVLMILSISFFVALACYKYTGSSPGYDSAKPIDVEMYSGSKVRRLFLATDQGEEYSQFWRVWTLKSDVELTLDLEGLKNNTLVLVKKINGSYFERKIDLTNSSDQSIPLKINIRDEEFNNLSSQGHQLVSRSKWINGANFATNLISMVYLIYLLVLLAWMFD
ncbi:hypothetical protein [Reichenbachiella versicolor]|uniref:hypothetical protein n=1 Tax=Reichenbachiella versicolor TaxID=1821036 RepID=UPI000D6DF825|nr:hypothetical protein [Reichenbachiella versicolor]